MIDKTEAMMKIYPNGDGTVLYDLWQKCLSEGREVLTLAEVKGASVVLNPGSAGNTFSIQPSKVEIPEWSFDHEKYGNWD